jgi:hypothetical protein
LDVAATSQSFEIGRVTDAHAFSAGFSQKLPPCHNGIGHAAAETEKRGWRLLILVVLLGAMVAAC